MFIDRAKDYATVTSDDVVKKNLFTCLRGDALRWYTSEMIEAEKRLLRYGEGLAEWETALTERFKESPAVAAKILANARYTFDDARRMREPREYAQTIVRAVKATGEITFTQLLTIYNGLEVEFQRDVAIPESTTTLSNFLLGLDSKKNIWWEIGKQRSGQQQQSKVSTCVGNLLGNLLFAVVF